MLVYFDSAQFAWLERATAAERASFREVCQRASVEAVVPLEHLIEIGQLRTLENAVARARVLGLLPSLRSAGQSSAQVVRWEIQQQLSASYGVTVQSTQDLRDRIFPRCTVRDVEQSIAAQFAIFQAMRGAFEGASEAEALRKSVNSQVCSRS